MKLPLHIIVVVTAGFFSVLAQSPKNKAVQVVQSYRQANEKAVMKEFLELLALPNIAFDSSGMQKNARFIMEMMKQRGISSVQLLPAQQPSSPPAVYGEVKTPGATKTVVFYAHYDGQPVNPAEWTEGTKPFFPLLKTNRLDNHATTIDVDSILNTSGRFNDDWRIFARSTSDDKGGVMAIISAFAALKNAGLTPGINIKFFFEGEEEAGSIHLGEILERHKTLLQSDLWVICDGPVHQTGKKLVYFGVRGDVNVDLTVFGPKRPLHSGHYGNWIPNPGHKLAHLLASMKDTNGKVTIDGFYDDAKPLSKREQEALIAAPNADTDILHDLGVAKPEGMGKRLVEVLTMPSLNINGMRSANVGIMAANVIPVAAYAVLDLRLVAGNDHQKQIEKIARHIQKMGYLVLERDPTDVERKQYPNIAKLTARAGGYNAQRTSMDLPIAQAVVNAVQSTSDSPIVLLPSTGGSLPLYLFEKYLSALTITVPIANHDNNQHAENENLKIKNFWGGVESMTALMLMN